MLYESYIHPIIILSTLPSAGVGALLALMLSGNDLGVIGVIGIIPPIGAIKKNAPSKIERGMAKRIMRPTCKAAPAGKAKARFPTSALCSTDFSY